MGNKDIAIGTKLPCRENRTIDAGDFSILHQLTGFNTSIHSDAEYAKQTLFKERPVAGPIIFVMADGLIHQSNSFAEFLSNHGYKVYAYAGVEDIKNTYPVFVGDTLRADAEIVEFNSTKKPGLCRLRYKNRVYNQFNEQVLEYTSIMLIIEK